MLYTQVLYASYKGIRKTTLFRVSYLRSSFVFFCLFFFFVFFFNTRKDHRDTLVTEFARRDHSTRQFCSQHVQHLTEVQSVICLGYFTFDGSASGQLCYLHHAWQNCFWSTLLATSPLSELLPVISVIYITLIRTASGHLCYLHHAYQNCFRSSLLATSRLSELVPVISVIYITLIIIASGHLC